MSEIMQNYQIETTNGTVNYYECGDPKNPTIICLHGLAGNGFYSFAELMPFLQHRFHLIVLDSPGHGGTFSFSNEEEYSFANLAAWLNDLIPQLTDSPFYVLGYSWGADVALHFTRYYSANVLGLMMLDGGFTFPQNQPEMTFDYAYIGWQQYMDESTFQTEKEIFEEYRSYTNNWNSQKERYALSLFKKQLNGEFRLKASTHTVLSIIKAFFKESFTEAYPFLQIPVLLIHAEHPKEMDTARMKGICQLKEQIKDVTVQIMNDTSHMIQWDQPEETANVIAAWINGKSD